MEERKQPTDILRTIEQEMDSDIHPALKKILDNIRPIGLAVGGIVVAVAVFAGVRSFQESQREKAVAEMGRILILADQNARMERLQTFAQTAPTALKPAIQLELARIYMDRGDFEKAADAWRNVGNEAGMGVVSGMGEAKALMLKGDHAAAVTVLSGLKKDAGEEFLSAVSANLAFAAEMAGQNDLAIAEYEFLRAKDSGNEAFLDYKIGRLKNHG